MGLLNNSEDAGVADSQVTKLCMHSVHHGVTIMTGRDIDSKRSIRVLSQYHNVPEGSRIF